MNLEMTWLGKLTDSSLVNLVPGNSRGDTFLLLDPVLLYVEAWQVPPQRGKFVRDDPVLLPS